MNQTQQYHILNGDSLKDAFPSQLLGKKLVARECLVDGDVQCDTLEALFATRSKFISESYDGYSTGDYEKISAAEFVNIQAIPDDGEINLWFEDDLFCQVNLWFVLYLLCQTERAQPIYLIRPTTSLQFGFGGMNEEELIRAFNMRVQIRNRELSVLKELWPHYQNGNTIQLLKIAEEYHDAFPFLLPAVKAHIDRLPIGSGLGKPEQVLSIIMKEFNTHDFGIIFQEFCKREPIYGFGDLQVKRMLEQMNNNQ